jgi:hypothetical protein
MALLLFMAQTRSRPDLTPEVATRTLYVVGDLIDVYEDDRHDGDLVVNPIMPPFVLIKVTGVTKAQVERYLDPDVEETLVNGEVQRTVLRRRRFRLRVEDLPAGVRQTLTQDRYYETTLAAIRSFIRDKVTGLDEG